MIKSRNKINNIVYNSGLQKSSISVKFFKKFKVFNKIGKIVILINFLQEGFDDFIDRY